MIELIVYCFIVVLLMVAVYSLYSSGRKLWEGASGSYMISQDFEAGVRYLRADLKETSLISLRTYPNATNSGAQPGVSMESARSYDVAGKLLVSMHGAPQWDKHIFYSLQSNGNLVRWDKKNDPQSFLPLASALLPSELSDGTHRRVVLRNLLQPNQDYGLLGKTDGYGGFRVSFVTYPPAGGEAMTAWNPAQVSAGEAPDVDKKAVGRLVEVELKGMTQSGFGKANYYAIRFRVTPRH